MLGFADEALILLPKQETYETRNATYKYNFTLSIKNLIKYLQMMNIQPYGLYTDDIMRDLRPEGVKLISVLSTADSYFAATNCDGMHDALTVEKWSQQDIIDKANLDTENIQDMSVEERFNLLLKHEKKVVKAFIASYKIVFIYNYPNKKNYTATSKPGDERIRVYIDANTFVPQVYMSGSEINACDILNVPYGSRSLAKWEL